MARNFQFAVPHRGDPERRRAKTIIRYKRLKPSSDPRREPFPSGRVQPITKPCSDENGCGPRGHGQVDSESKRRPIELAHSEWGGRRWTNVRQICV